MPAGSFQICWQKNDSRAVKMAKEERELLRSLLGATYFQPFENAVNQYDFEEALETLKTAVPAQSGGEDQGS